ncbi:MAG: ATP-binding cassette domain-containing protein [Candidatus Krumholzibacteriia bacterium]
MVGRAAAGGEPGRPPSHLRRRDAAQRWPRSTRWTTSFAVRPGETLGLGGESGCGKSTVGRALLNILWTTAPDVEIKGHAYSTRTAARWTHRR